MVGSSGAPSPPQRHSRRPPALYVTVAASRKLAWILVGLHGVAIAALVIASIPMPAKVGAICAIIWTGIRETRRHALRVGKDACVALRFRQAGRCEVLCRDGKRIEGRIHGGSYVLPGLTIVRVLQQGRPRSLTVLLLPDAVSADAMRRLRVWLRWTGDADREKSAHDLSL